MTGNAVELFDVDQLLSGRGRNAPAAAITDPVSSSKYISFIYGFPDTASLPNSTVLESTRRALAEHGDWALQYGKTTGVPALADALLAKLRRDQGIVATPENVMITAGGSQGVQLVLDVFVDPGDIVVAESPTWMGFIDALMNVGGRLETVPMDECGTDTTALAEKLRSLEARGTPAKLIYLITNFQNPTGISTSLPRRKAIAALAAEHGVMILEDDAYFDLRYSGETLPPIYTLDPHGVTIYLGTLSKIMGAGMRIGWLVGPERVIQHLAKLKIDGGTNIFGSHVAADWLALHYDEHIELLRTIYARRRDLMLASLQRHMPTGTIWTKPEGGFFVWLTLPEQIDAGRMLEQAREAGIEYLPGATCYMDGSGRNQIRLSFSFAPDDRIDRGIEILAGLVRGEMLEVGVASG